MGMVGQGWLDAYRCKTFQAQDPCKTFGRSVYARFFFAIKVVSSYPLDRDCALTFCWLENVLNTTILQLPEGELCMQDKIGAVTAINKVRKSRSTLQLIQSKIFWIQNDLFARHYINE